MSEYRLTQEIMDRSFAKTWAEAKLEWEIAEVYKRARARNMPLRALPNH